MNLLPFYSYVATALFAAIYLTIKSGSYHKYLTFIIVYWLFAHSVLNSEYFIIDISILPFDLQPNRILFLVFISYLLISLGKSVQRHKLSISKNPKFERYLYIMIFLAIIIDLIHTTNILNFREFIVNATAILTFLVLYLVVKKSADLGMIKAVRNSLLIICIFSSLIGIYQFFVNPYFFRLGSEREAFGLALRSNGIFSAEYYQSYFLLTGLIMAILTVRKKSHKYALISLFLFGISLTFHRMSWIITLLILAWFFIKKIRKKNISRLIIASSTAGTIVLCILLFFIQDFRVSINPKLVEEGIFRNTLNQRINYFSMVLKRIPHSWIIGYGSKKSNEYYYGMLEAGAPESYARDEEGGIHNFYFELMFLRGIPILIVYLIFLALAFRYFQKLARFEHPFYLIMTFEVLKFILLNITNSFEISDDLGLLLAIFLAIGVAVHQKKIDTSGLVRQIA